MKNRGFRKGNGNYATGIKITNQASPENRKEFTKQDHQKWISRYVEWILSILNSDKNRLESEKSKENKKGNAYLTSDENVKKSSWLISPINTNSTDNTSSQKWIQQSHISGSKSMNNIKILSKQSNLTEFEDKGLKDNKLDEVTTWKSDDAASDMNAHTFQKATILSKNNDTSDQWFSEHELQKDIKYFENLLKEYAQNLEQQGLFDDWEIEDLCLNKYVSLDVRLNNLDRFLDREILKVQYRLNK